MPKLICSNCGWWDDEEEFYWEKDYDDYGWECPNCHKGDGWLSEPVQCQVCGDWFGSWDMVGGGCRDCLWETAANRTDIVLGYLVENADSFGEYVAEIIDKEYQIRNKNRPK